MSAETVEIIPASLAIEVRGEVITSNANEFREMVRAALATINRSPSTDEEFGQAELDSKGLKAAEDAVKAAKEKALADASQLHALFSTLDETSEEIRAARLELEKQIKARKEEVRTELINEAINAIDASSIAAFRGELENAVKGKRTLDSMRKALDVAVRLINRRVADARKILDQFEAAHGPEMVMDRQELELKTTEAVEAELRRRLEAKRLKAEAEMAKAEAAKAKAETAATKRELDEVGKPPLPDPPKVGRVPTGPSPLAEWTGFMAAVMGAFKPLKEAKEGLRHPENQEKAAKFATAVNAAWLEVKNQPSTN